jgi:hypothetical protein
MTSEASYSPPILQTSFHSSAVTGCTDSREYFTSAMLASFLSALIAAIVTAFEDGILERFAATMKGYRTQAKREALLAQVVTAAAA